MKIKYNISNFRKEFDKNFPGFYLRIREDSNDIAYYNGLKAFDTVNTSGNALKHPNTAKNTNKAISPPKDLLILFFFFDLRCTFKSLISEKGRESIRLDLISLMSNLSFFLATTSHLPF